MIVENLTLDTTKSYLDIVDTKSLFEAFHLKEECTGLSTCYDDLLEEFLKSFYFELLVWQTELTVMPTCPKFWTRDYSDQESFYGFTIEQKFDEINNA